MSTNKRTSKRQDWKTVTLYLRPDTHEQLKRTALMQSLDACDPLDQSDIADKALRDWFASSSGDDVENPTLSNLGQVTMPEAIALAVDAWLQAQNCNDKGIEPEPADKAVNVPPLPTDEAKVRFTVDLPKSLHKRLQMVAFHRDCNMTDLARQALNEWLSANS